LPLLTKTRGKAAAVTRRGKEYEETFSWDSVPRTRGPRGKPLIKGGGKVVHCPVVWLGEKPVMTRFRDP